MTIKIKYASDLHLEFNPPASMFQHFEGDLLILAGDIVDGKLKGLDTLIKICDNFNYVIMVMGNHEFYKSRFPTAYAKLKDNLPNNTYLLQNEIIDIDGQRFLGATLWSFMGSIDSYFAKVRMNDYRYIRTGPADKAWLRKLSPEDTISDHIKTTKWLENSMQEGDIIITHHAPSFVSCNPDYEGNSAYATDLSDIILDYNPKIWVHGHLHQDVDYKIGNTRVISNPMGYYGDDNVSDFQFKEITI